MLMMCWFYCIPFAKGLFFASGFLLILLSLFILKRGIRRSRPKLRRFAFVLMFAAILKIFTVDIYYLKGPILCGIKSLSAACNPNGFKTVQFLGLLALVVSSMLLLNLYRSFLRDRKQLDLTPTQVHLPFWGNFSISLVILLILWLAAPWAGYLTVGHVPKMFMQVPWQNLAIVNIIVLLIGFWKLEDCVWIYNPAEKTKKHLINVWTAKDTLWMSLILFLIALAFSYASNDVLSGTMREESRIKFFDDIDLSGMSEGFQSPVEMPAR